MTSARAGLYVQYGCGLSAPAGWRNFDASPNLRLQRIPVLGALACRLSGVTFPRGAEHGDIVHGLPIPPESCDGIYASHVLEHLALEDFRVALRNTLRYLRSGGCFRAVVPDLRVFAQEYVASEDASAASRFMERSLLGSRERARGLLPRLRALVGNSGHLWMWDYPALRQELLAAGFATVRRAYFGDSEDRRFAEVEEAGRWEDAVGVECTR